MNGITDTLLLEVEATTTVNSSDDSNRRRRLEYSRSAVMLVFCVPALGGFLFGYDISATSYAIAQLIREIAADGGEEDNLPTNASLLSPAWQGLIVAAASLGAFLGSLWIFDLADLIGRRSELRYGSLFYMAGAMLEVLAGLLLLGSTTRSSTIQWLAVAVLIAGRLVYGLGIAFAMHGGPTYLGEMAPSSIRGLLVSLKEAVIVLGILSGYVVGFVFSTTKGGWMLTYGSSLVVSSGMLALSYTIPRSCRWLLLHGNEDEALESMRFVFTAERAEEEFADMVAKHNEGGRTLSVREAGESPNFAMPPTRFFDKSIWKIEYRAPLTAGIGLVVLQQITGQPSILSYAIPIFKKAGLSDSATIFVALFKLVATLSAAVTVERYGRKTLLYIGITLMLLALLGLTVCFGSSVRGVDALVLTAIFVYIGGYQFSFGPISWLLISEVFPLEVRGQAVAVAVQNNFFFNAVVQFVVPVLERSTGLNAMFGIFAILTAYR